MGGASRAEKKRKQEAANARLRAAGITPPTKKSDGKRTTFIAVASLAFVALVVGMVVLLTRDGGEPVVPTYTATAEGAVVTAGTGPVVVDIWSDYFCPACERFEERFGDELTTALNNGQITVRHHEIAILDDRSDPPGYSTRAANAAVCASTAGIYPAFHDRLFDAQPSEGGPGLTDEQLVAFGTELGADIEACVTGGTNSAAVTAETEAAVANPALRTGDSFGTPTVTVDGTLTDFGDGNWLQDAIGA